MYSEWLPDEIIFNILSYLPLWYLYKFKCVCKHWNTSSLHPFFLYLHDIHSPFSALLDEDVEIFISLDIKCRDTWRFRPICQSSHTLVLEKNNYFQTSCYHIEASHLRYVLPIPNPQNLSLCITLEFVPPFKSNRVDGAVKLVSVLEDGKKLSYEVLTLEIRHLNTCPSWQAIPSNSKYSDDGRKKRKNIQFLFRMGVAYCIWFVKVEDDDLVDTIEVDVLDMVNETYIGHTTFPRASFEFSKLSMSSTHLLDWNGCLSFAQQLKDELHVLVLDDHTRLKWAETKRIIKLHFLKQSTDHKRLITFHACCDKSFLIFLWQDDKDKDKQSLCKYDIYTEELWTCEPHKRSCGTMTDAEFVALEFPSSRQAYRN